MIIMKTTIKQKLMGIALSVLSITAFGQCAQITGLNVTYGANGTATITPSISGSTNPMLTTYYWQTSAGVSQTGWGSQGTFQFPANGFYNVCLTYNDSSTFCSQTYCDSVYITNMAATSCSAGFTYNTDSSCVTHFINTSVGSNLTYQWIINGTTYSTSINPNVSLPNGTYNAFLYTYSGGVFCDSTYQLVSVACGSTTPSGCNASYSYYRDSSCVTHFVNTSTGSNLSYSWNIDGTNYTTANPVVYLTSGYHSVTLYTFSNGVFCDSIGGNNSYLVNTCSTLPTLCNVNPNFTIFADSMNAGNYFAYNNSTASGPMTYLWDFGDGSTSNSVYPFHQYAVPGHYVICLTVTAQTGSVSCSGTYCDSSSVHRMASGFLMSQFQVLPQSVTGVKDQSIIKGFKAFPNPMADELSFEFELNSANHIMSYQLIDALGKVISKNNIVDSKTTINTSALDKGFYFLQIRDENGKAIKTTKLVK